MAFQRPEGERQARQHRLRLQQFQYAVAPGIEKRQRARVPHQRPQPVEPVRGIARQERQCAGVGLVGFDAAPIEQPDVGQRAEQRAPVGACAAFLQVLDVADEDRDAGALLGDDVELIQSLFVPAQGEAGQEFLDGGVARPEGDEDQVAVLVTDDAIGHQVGAFVDAIERLGGRRCRHGDVLEVSGDSTNREGSHCPRGMEEDAVSVVVKNQTVRRNAP